MRLPQFSTVRGLLALFGSLASITGILITFIVTIGLPPFDNGPDGTPTPPVPTSTPDETTVDPTELATGLLAVVEVYECGWGPSTVADSEAELGLTIVIAGNPDFSGQLYVESEENNREPWTDRMVIGEDDWNPEDGQWVTYGLVSLELKAEDLKKLHDIVVRVDPDNDTKGFEESKNETSVRVYVPDNPPSESEDLDRCTSPVP